MHLDHQIAGTGDGVLDVFIVKNVGRAERIENHCLHGRLLS
jgi:hypothetical protein